MILDLVPTRKFFNDLFPSTYSIINPRKEKSFSEIDYIFDQLLMYSDFTMENKDGFLEISIDMPGVKKEDVDLSIKNKILNIEAERKVGGKGKIKKQFLLSKNVDVNSIEARMEEGILFVKMKEVIPEEEKRKKIKIC